MREVDGKWLPTLWRFCDGPQEDGFDEYGVETYGEHDKAGGVSFYKSADKKPSAVFRPYEPPAEEPATSIRSGSARAVCWSTGTPDR